MDCGVKGPSVSGFEVALTPERESVLFLLLGLGDDVIYLASGGNNKQQQQRPERGLGGSVV